MIEDTDLNLVNYDLLSEKLINQSFSNPLFAQDVVNVAGLTTSSLTLDLGCGTGYTAKAIHQLSGGTILGLDKSFAMLRGALNNIPVIAGRAEMVPTRSNIFDCVVAAFVVHLVQDLRAVLREAFRVLRHGPLIILTASEEDLARRYANRYFPALLPLDLKRYPSISFLIDVLGQVGFSEINIKPLLLKSVALDQAYVAWHEKRTWSSLVLLADQEFKSGIIRMKQEILWQTNESPRVVPWVRTVVTGWKKHMQLRLSYL